MTRSVLPPGYVQRLFRRSNRQARLLSHLLTENDKLRKQVAILTHEVNRFKRFQSVEAGRDAKRGRETTPSSDMLVSHPARPHKGGVLATS